MDSLTERRKERILKVRLKYAEIVKDLECPFVWHFYRLFDSLEFSRYLHDTATIADLSLNVDETQALADYSDQIVRVYCHFIMNGAQFALTELSLFMRKLSECSSDGSSKKALFFVAKSCDIFLYLLGGKEEKAMALKSHLRLLKSRKNQGHLQGIQGLIAVRLNESVHALPFLRNAVSATEHYEYSFNLAKTLSRIRFSKSSFDVSDEELSLLEKVAKDHYFAIPMLADTLGSKILYLYLQRNKRFTEMNSVQHQQRLLLEDAWTNRGKFGAKGLTRLANTFGVNPKLRDNAKVDKLYSMAYEILPNDPYNLHRYGLFLAKFKPEKTIKDVENGLDFLARAKHLAAFVSMVGIYHGGNVDTRDLKPFESYLESFIEKAETMKDKRVFLYVAYKYYLQQLHSITPALHYLKLGINEDPAEMKIGTHLTPRQKKVMSSISFKGNNTFFPQDLDLSYEAGYITDHTALFGEEHVVAFKRWWQEHPVLKLMESYAGFEAYYTEQGRKGARSLDDGSKAKYRTGESSSSSRNDRDEEESCGSSTSANFDSDSDGSDVTDDPRDSFYRDDSSETDEDEPTCHFAGATSTSKTIATNETVTDARTTELQPMRKELDLLEENRYLDNQTFLTFIYKNFFPKHKPNAALVRLAMLPENIQEASRSGTMKKLLRKALVHYHPDTINEEAHGLAWKYFCEEITKVLTPKFNNCA